MGFPQIVQMTVEGWGAFFCIVAAIVIWQTKAADKSKVIGLIRFVAADGLLLLSDAFAIGFRGREGEAAFYIVRIYILCWFYWCHSLFWDFLL